MDAFLQQGAATHQVRELDVFLVQCKLFYQFIVCSAHIYSHWKTVCDHDGAKISHYLF